MDVAGGGPEADMFLGHSRAGDKHKTGKGFHVKLHL